MNQPNMKKITIAGIVMMAASPAFAEGAPKDMTPFAQKQMQRIARNPGITAAIHAQNGETETLNDAQILELDHA